jgi:hypothetical protein
MQDAALGQSVGAQGYGSRDAHNRAADVIIQEYKIAYLFHPVRSALPISQPLGKRGWI